MIRGPSIHELVSQKVLVETVVYGEIFPCSKEVYISVIIGEREREREMYMSFSLCWCLCLCYYFHHYLFCFSGLSLYLVFERRKEKKDLILILNHMPLSIFLSQTVSLSLFSQLDYFFFKSQINK
jgi:hypothetical protein